MKYLLIYCTFVGMGIGFDFIRLFVAKASKFEVKEFSIFMGPKLISTIIFNMKLNIGVIPFGSYMKLDESFLQRDRFSKILPSYLIDILLLITAFIIITHVNNDILVSSSKLLLIVNGFFVIVSVILDSKHIFYRHKSDF
jgi:uncharacterized membrane protein SirB2